MGDKNDGYKCDHLNSQCCQKPIRFETKNGYSLQAWCSECGKYVFTGRIESLIALKMGDLNAYRLNYNGYNPEWVKTIQNCLTIDENNLSIADEGIIYIKEKMEKAGVKFD